MLTDVLTVADDEAAVAAALLQHPVLEGATITVTKTNTADNYVYDVTLSSTVGGKCTTINLYNFTTYSFQFSNRCF